MKHARPEKQVAYNSALSSHAAKQAEMEQAVIRLVMGFALIGYYVYGTWHAGARQGSWWLASDSVMAAWLAICVGLIVAIRLGKPFSRIRRLVAITTDVANTTYFI